MPKIMAQHPKIESIGSTGSIILGTLGGPGTFLDLPRGLGSGRGPSWGDCSLLVASRKAKAPNLGPQILGPGPAKPRKMFGAHVAGL